MTARAVRLLWLRGGEKVSRIGTTNLFVGDLRAAVEDSATFDVIVSLLDPDYTLNLQSSLRIDMVDAEGQELEPVLAKVVSFLRPVAPDKRVLIHCVEGRSRSAAVCMGVLMKLHGYSFEEAHELVTSSRKTANPIESFITQLRAM